ncbi:ornithine cyclodeaminase family protein [Candidatus Poriferisocius sp.]|uniref:ornithine cyclodeaminase family protein n=1 Tax=Candidatus Poriferisocius sp. TaxID=3101276 RepID=UPI003B014069
MRFLDSGQIRSATVWDELIDAIAEIIADDAVVAPDRQVLSMGRPGEEPASLLLMPGWINREIVGVKAATFFPSNAGTSSSTIHAIYLCFDGQNGKLKAVLDGDELTARRTAAVSALAARTLARPDAARLLVVGTGQLAPNMARAHSKVRRFEAIQIWGRNPAAAREVAELLAAEGLPATATSDLDESIGRADIISCATSATSPLVFGERLAPGTHLDLVGSFRPDMREVDDAAITQAALFVDTVPGAVQSGDLAQPLADGAISEESIIADLRSLVTDRHPGRRIPEEVTVFKSAGFALADLAAARLALRQVDHHPFE